MASASSRPRLRPVELIVVPEPHRSGGRALMLRDTQGVAPSHVVLALDLYPIVARMNGRQTCEEIAKELSRESGTRVAVSVVVQVAEELEAALFADGAPYRKARDRIEKEFAEATVRPASHAGGAYHGDRDKLVEYIDNDCLAAAKPNGKRAVGRLVGLVAPHIDPWRGARCYGHAYAALRRDLPADVDTFVVFGTSHAPMREPFALCRKAFDTPLGRAEAHFDAIDAIARSCDFDPYFDQLNHKREHSLEFQVVFLQHLLNGRANEGAPSRVRIVPILAGLGDEQSSGKNPDQRARNARFLDAVRRVVEDYRAVVIAGADLAHVGPRFGDDAPFDDGERRALDETDHESIGHAAAGDHRAFWKHVAADLDTRRVCGLGPIWSLLRTIDPDARGVLGHYEQTVDPDEGSIVSHAAMGFYLGAPDPPQR